MACKEKPSKSILKSEQEQAQTLGTYNIHTKRASFKDDVILQQFIQDKCELTTPPVVEARLSMTSDETEEELTAEEISRRKEFKQKRRLVDLEGADGLNLKAVLAHRVSLPGVGGEEEDEDEGKGENVSYQDEQMPGGSVYTGGDESISLPSKSLEQESDSNWSFPDTENVSIDTSGNKSSHPESFDDPITVSYSVPNIVNRLSMSTSASASKEKQTDGDRKK